MVDTADASSSKNNNNNSGSSRRNKSGVADYFAILGVGDKLIWKHAQKQTIYEQAELAEPAEEDEDEASLAQRFDREIVDVSVLAVDAASIPQQSASTPTTNTTTTTTTTTTTASEDYTNNNAAEPPAVTAVASYQTDSSQEQHSFSSHSLHKNNTTGSSINTTAGAAGSAPGIPLPTSPSHSEATTAATLAPLQPPTVTTAVADPTTGWTLLQQTLPARHSGSLLPSAPPLWNKFQVWDANLHSQSGLRGEIQTAAAVWQATLTQNAASGPKPLKGLRRKMESTIRSWQQRTHAPNSNNSYSNHKLPADGTTSTTKFYLAYRRRRQSACCSNNSNNNKEEEATVRPAIADVSLHYVRVHKSILTLAVAAATAAAANNDNSSSGPTNHTSSNGISGIPMAALAGQILERYQSSQGKQQDVQRQVSDATTAAAANEDSLAGAPEVAIADYLTLPDGFDEWSIPQDYQFVRDPSVQESPKLHSNNNSTQIPNRRATTVLFEHADDATYASGDMGVGVEAFETVSDVSSGAVDPAEVLPRLVGAAGLPDIEDSNEGTSNHNFVYIPILAVRRQRMGDEERYNEDAGLVDLTISFADNQGEPVLPDDTHVDDDEDEEDEGTFRLLGKTTWSRSASSSNNSSNNHNMPITKTAQQQFGLPLLLIRRNVPFGFADAAFATRVLGRFPFRNYKGLPLPEEELPMFCYPTGCRLHRARFSDAPLAQYYGFVVKNERGDSIYVSCVSFMEPLTHEKVNQLANMSEKRRRFSLSHQRFCERRDRRTAPDASKYHARGNLDESDSSAEADDNFLLTGFDEMTTFENKTICLVSRFPFWTAFRKFLSHLHILSGLTSDLPLERCISHLLLSVPIPTAGGCSILVPLPALNDPMVLWLPPEKDFPLVDLPYHRLMACLDIATIVMIVLGLLGLERKIIVMSTRPSLVLDICELLRSLLFPFDLCAPYVPRLTEPFKTSLEFPGAIFVGIHDDGTPNGLATCVRKDLPEDSIIIDLDTGEVECSGDRQVFIANTWDVIPESARLILVSELETLCRDAGIVPGQEPLDSQMDSAFDVTLPSAVEGFDVADHSREPLDDRAVRDTFLRFFCNLLGGYERYLVVPDADFLVSGNEWFDSKGFLASVPSEKAPYLNNLVGTQLFQSFIQKRTEASDVHCMLFDECLAEFHASPNPYGRLGEDVETVPDADGGQPHMVYSLLVDQAAMLPSNHEQLSMVPSRSMDASEAESSVGSIRYSESVVNMSGDIVTAPSRQDLKDGVKYIYCIDGNPCFPHHFKPALFLPKEPESWLVEMSKASDPLLARSEKEVEEANRRRRLATSLRGFQNQRRCLWQLPKLMGSHFLGAWLLCIPAQVSQAHLSHEQQSRYLLRALGALRLMRSKQRIVPDEAAYRALMVACGRARSDRRVELVKLFGLLRSDGIFPSAVTLGQYTRAVAEGYSKRSSGLVQEDDYGGVEVTESASRVGRSSFASPSQKGSVDVDACLSAMDGNLSILETQGRRWRQRSGAERATDQFGRNAASADAEEKKKRNQQKSWLPVVFSTSLAPGSSEDLETNGLACIRLIALWSRTTSCDSCGYIPLEEEVQAGWDVVGENEVPNAVACPRCGMLFVPRLGYQETTVEESISIGDGGSAPTTNADTVADFGQLPPQMGPSITSWNGASYVTYLSPASLRIALERYVEDYGEEVLARERMRELDPEVFYNFWWYCSRFSLPLPLPIVITTDRGASSYIAFAGWDRSAAERGCFSAAKSISSLVDSNDYFTDSTGATSDESFGMFEDLPFLSRFNLQSYW